MVWWFCFVSGGLTMFGVFCIFFVYGVDLVQCWGVYLG